MRRDDQSVSDPREIVEWKQQADSGFSRPSVLHFDLAEVVVPKKETAAGRSGDGHNIALAFGHQARQRRIVLEDEIHLPFEASGKPLPAAAQRSALRANMVKNSIGEGEKDVHWIVCCCRHEAKQSITKCITFSRRLDGFRLQFWGDK